MTIFADLCSIATDNTITFEVAVAVDTAIKKTEEGKQCDELIKKYSDGLITLAEFRNAFITVALK